MLLCATVVGCEASEDSSERVRVAALEFDLEGRDVCVFIDDQVLRLEPSGQGVDVTDAASVDLADEVFVGLVDSERSCDAEQAVRVRRFDLEPDLNDETDYRTVVLSQGEDGLEAEMLFEVEDASLSTRSCSAGDSYVVRTSICSSSGTITTVSLRECQSVYVMQGEWANIWVTTGSWTTTSGGGCDDGPGGPHEQ